LKKAVKFDQGKPRMDLVDMYGLIGEAKAMGYGAKKYEAYNYLNGDGLEWYQPYSACLRHLTAFWKGEELDPESGLPHVYHAKACVGMLIGLIERGIGKDSRHKRSKKKRG